MKNRGVAMAAFGFLAACASASPPPPPMQPFPQPEVAAPATTSRPVCEAVPSAPITKKPPSCESYTLKGGQSFHDQLAVQLSSGAFSQMDCPRMRYRGQDTPVCVAKEVGGRTVGACCPPGHTDPTDPACTSETFLHQMMAGGRTWEWCQKGESPSNACAPCVWPSNAQR